MRLDKFLKVSRIIKRRTIANDACDNGRVAINSKVAKAGAEVKIGDVISINFGDKTVSFKVLQIFTAPKKDETEQMFEVISNG
ncbi:MAG: RNA-binding S4 domain-containing protein [Clostridia bacterium]